MSVRKRKWITRSGEPQEAWVVDYVANGRRHLKTFARKKDADACHANVTVDVAKGIHTPESRSLTVAQAADQWLAAGSTALVMRQSPNLKSSNAARSTTTVSMSASTSCRASAP
jgi:hypothetical protein